jgi:Arf-GAP/SH3 domain/ANK repeat/PH domain-containing protein
VVSLFAAHVDNEMYLSRSLERLGSNALSKDQEPDIGAAFLKFAVVTKELSALMKTLVSTPFLLSELRNIW